MRAVILRVLAAVVLVSGCGDDTASTPGTEVVPVTGMQACDLVSSSTRSTPGSAAFSEAVYAVASAYVSYPSASTR
jgi:hypothetical protein